MNLVPVYRVKDHEMVLYRLLRERDGKDDINISHRSMPTLEEHAEFVRSRPYHAWYLIELPATWAGAIYLTKGREIGVHLFEAFQGKGIGSQAVEALMERWPGKFRANINPRNERSLAFFEKLGFKPLQVTYER